MEQGSWNRETLMSKPFFKRSYSQTLCGIILYLHEHLQPLEMHHTKTAHFDDAGGFDSHGCTETINLLKWQKI